MCEIEHNSSESDGMVLSNRGADVISEKVCEVTDDCY